MMYYALQKLYLVFPIDDFKPEFKYGGKIILPSSYLNELANEELTWPLLFQLRHPSGKTTHCGVIEFTGEEDCVHIPYWMMQVIGAKEGDQIFVTPTELKKGSFAKFRPKTIDFFDTISDIRRVLEILLKDYSALTVGDTIAISYIGKEFFLEILECKPDKAISILETDISVEFEQPEGYTEVKEEPKKKEPVLDDIELQIEYSDDEDNKPVQFEGKGRKLNPKKPVEEIIKPIEKMKKKKVKKMKISGGVISWDEE